MVLLKVLPQLTTATLSSDDTANHERRENFRVAMRTLLGENIHIASVTKLLDEVEADEWVHFSRDALNGFYCCLALSRHAYRWALMPVVKIAQLEKEIRFPPELAVPWPYMQRYFGVVADSGNHTSNVLSNFTEGGERMFKFNSTLSPSIQSTEEAFFKLLYNVEAMGFDIYYDMVIAIVSYQNGKRDSCLRRMRSISDSLKRVIQLFHQQMKESRISRRVWLSYVQGFHGWGLGRWIKNEFVQFNGVSGNHILLFQALDAFLGMEPYLSNEDMVRYIPSGQRSFCRSLKEQCLRGHLDEDKDLELKEEFNAIVRQMKQYRVAHRTRVMPYLKQPAPERFHMTAGKSVLTTDLNVSIEEAIEPLDHMLATRLKETI
ncbi:hypothetical protein F4810DRAFT_681133 [Camillea tinctor]|nr:hypothetical protein F4810DRAFT_681133 [Camillea tinctor]